MRIAVLNDKHAEGGAVSLMAYRFVKALQDAGHDASLLCGQGKDALPDDIPVFSWQYPSRQKGFLGQLRFFSLLTRRSGEIFRAWVKQTKTLPDLWIPVVPPSAWGAFRLGGGERIPYCYICNSPWGQEWLSDYRGTRKYEAGFLQRSLHFLPRRNIERRLVSRAQAWLALSQTQVAWFEKEHPGCQKVPKYILPGAVDAQLFKPLLPAERGEVRSRYGVKNLDRAFFLCSRRLVARTGVDLLLQALAGGKFDFFLVITGDGPERQRLETLCQELQLKHKVRFTGFLPREELLALTAAASLCILPTRELEGFGLSAAEAFSAGTPVVATPVGALVDVVGNFDRRLLSQQASAESLRECLESFMQEEFFQNESFRERCREYALKHFDWCQHQERFVKIIEEMVS